MIMHVTSFDVFDTGSSGAQQCRDTGSVAFSEGSTVVQNMTYVAPGYRILCDSVVVGWEFCYQIVNVPIATFYPSVWRLDSGNYILINTSTVSFVPQQTIGITFTCESYHLQFDEMFDVLTNDSVGLYSGDNTAQILTTDFSSTIFTYSLTGNHSNISTANGEVMLEQINVAIVALISECYKWQHAGICIYLYVAS